MMVIDADDELVGRNVFNVFNAYDFRKKLGVAYSNLFFLAIMVNMFRKDLQVIILLNKRKIKNIDRLINFFLNYVHSKQTYLKQLNHKIYNRKMEHFSMQVMISLQCSR